MDRVDAGHSGAVIAPDARNVGQVAAFGLSGSRQLYLGPALAETQ